MLHPVNSRASWTSGLRVQFIHHSWLVDFRKSDSILAKDFTLDNVQRHAFALYIDLNTCTLLPGWIILINLGARRQKSQV